VSTWRLFLALGAVLLVSAAAAAGEATAIRDPAVGEVLRLLESGVSETVIVQWLGTTEPPREVSADDLIALRTAGASDELIQALLARVRGETPVPPPPAPETAPPAAPAQANESSVEPVRFEIRYLATYDPQQASADLFLYVDGVPVAWKEAGSRMRNTLLVFERSLSAGRHAVALGLERHVKQSRDRYRHEARVYPRPLVLDVRPGPETTVAIDLEEGGGFSLVHALGPLTFKVTQGQSTYAFLQGEGPDLGEWPALCEEVETNYPEGAKMPRSARKDLETCRRWADLWQDVANAPDRDWARDEMARYDYRPVPRGSRLH